jgi:hypothetical protein
MAQKYEPFAEAGFREAGITLVEAVVDVGGIVPVASSDDLQKDLVTFGVQLGAVNYGAFQREQAAHRVGDVPARWHEAMGQPPAGQGYDLAERTVQAGAATEDAVTVAGSQVVLPGQDGCHEVGDHLRRMLEVGVHHRYDTTARFGEAELHRPPEAAVALARPAMEERDPRVAPAHEVFYYVWRRIVRIVDEEYLPIGSEAG